MGLKLGRFVFVIFLSSCTIKAPDEWLGNPFVPQAYEVRWTGYGYVYLAPVTMEEAISWYRERLVEAGWVVEALDLGASRLGLTTLRPRRGLEEMSVDLFLLAIQKLPGLDYTFPLTSGFAPLCRRPRESADTDGGALDSALARWRRVLMKEIDEAPFMDHPASWVEPQCRYRGGRCPGDDNAENLDHCARCFGINSAAALHGRSNSPRL